MTFSDSKMVSSAKNDSNTKDDSSYTKTGADLCIGDVIQVCYKPYRDKIESFEPYHGSLEQVFAARKGARKAICHINPTGVTIDNEEIYKVYRNKETEIEKSFFKCLGKSLKIGDTIDVEWALNGDTITEIKPYVGPALCFKEQGMWEAKYLTGRKSYIDNGRMYNVFSRAKNYCDRNVSNDDIEKAEEMFSRETNEIESSDDFKRASSLALVKKESVTPPKPREVQFVCYKA